MLAICYCTCNFFRAKNSKVPTESKQLYDNDKAEPSLLGRGGREGVANLKI